MDIRELEASHVFCVSKVSTLSQRDLGVIGHLKPGGSGAAKTLAVYLFGLDVLGLNVLVLHKT